MPPPPLEILGRYKILRVVGRGAMGVVYEAIDPDIDRVVAIKTINLSLSPEEMVQYEARFKQEIKAAGRLNHPNIVTIYDVGKTEDFAYMAMEFINGCELKDLLRAGTALPIDVTLDIIAQAAEGLAFAHSRDIIHRDVKPANIMLLESEDGLVAKITDFGIARMPASAVKTMTGMVMGSPRYMSPEQVIGRNLSARSDIFSLGVVLYEALTGTAPFEADSISSIMYQTVHAPEQPPSNLNPNLGPELDAIVAKALAKSPDDRFESMKAFSRKLREVIRSRADLTAPSLAQLRTSPSTPAAPTLADALGVGTVPLAIVRDLDGTRLAPVMPDAPERAAQATVAATPAAPTLAETPPATKPVAAPVNAEAPPPTTPVAAPVKVEAPPPPPTPVAAPVKAEAPPPTTPVATPVKVEAPPPPPTPVAAPVKAEAPPPTTPVASPVKPEARPVRADVAPATTPVAPLVKAEVALPPVAAPAVDATPARPVFRLPVPASPPPQGDMGERTAWPVTVSNQFDSTVATLRLAEITAQTAELSEFISASRQMAAFKDVDTQEVKTPAPVVPQTANQRAAITLTMDPLPETPQRKIPLPPLLLLGGLGSTVLILLVALILSF